MGVSDLSMQLYWSIVRGIFPKISPQKSLLGDGVSDFSMQAYWPILLGVGISQNATTLGSTFGWFHILLCRDVCSSYRGLYYMNCLWLDLNSEHRPIFRGLCFEMSPLKLTAPTSRGVVSGYRSTLTISTSNSIYAFISFVLHWRWFCTRPA